MGLAKYTKDDKDRIARVEYPSGIDVKTVYGPEDLKRVGFSYEKGSSRSGRVPFHAGHTPRRVPEQALDHAAVFRVRRRQKRRTSASNS